MKEREINLIDLIVEVLLKWRMFLIWMLCGAILLGGLSYVRSWKEYNAQVAKLEDTSQQLETENDNEIQKEQNAASSQLLQQILEKLDEEQQHSVDYVLEYEDLYRQQLAYKEQSVLLQMDTDNIMKAVLSVWINAEDEEKDFSIEAAYEDTFQGGRMIQYVADQVGMTVSAVSELISLSHKLTNTTNVSGYNSFTLTVIHSDKKVCQDMLQAVTEFVESEQDNLQSVFGEFALTVVDQEPVSVYYPSVIDRKNAFVNNLIWLQDTITNRKNAFSQEQWQYYDVMVNGKITGKYEKDSVAEKEGEEDMSSDTAAGNIIATPKVSIKYVILGMILAAFCYAFYIFLGYVLHTKVCSTDDLQQIYSIPQLGMIPNDGKKKKFLGVIDQWILSLRYRNKRCFSEEEALKLVSVAVKLNAERETLDSVTLIGCDLKDRSMFVCDQLKRDLGKGNMQVGILNNVLYDAQSMSSLDNVKGVVLVEQAGSTLYTEIGRELELLKRQGIKILGGIVVE